MRVQGTELRVSARASSTLDCWAISSAPTLIFLNLNFHLQSSRLSSGIFIYTK